MKKQFFILLFLLGCIHPHAANVRALLFTYPRTTTNGVEYVDVVVPLSNVNGMDIDEKSKSVVLYTTTTDYQLSLVSTDYLGMSTTSQPITFRVATVDAIASPQDRRLSYSFSDNGISFQNLPAGTRVRVSDASGRLWRNIAVQRNCTLLRSELPKGVVIINVDGLTLKLNNR